LTSQFDTGAGGATRPMSRIGGGGFDNYMVDGLTTMSSVINRPTARISAESISEVKGCHVRLWGGIWAVQRQQRRYSLTILLFLLLSLPKFLQAEVIERTMQVRGTSFRYKVVLPANYDPAKTYPAILAFGGGSENMNAVDGVLNRYLRAEAERRGYIVVAPGAPDDHLVLWDGSEIFPEFLEKILADYKIENKKFHLAGVSNGGIAALEAAAARPNYFASVTVFPGYLIEPRETKLKAISKMCVFMFVGELDDDVWHDEMKKEVDFLHTLGNAAQYSIEKGQAHGIQSLAGANAGRLFDGFEQARAPHCSGGHRPPLQ